MANVVLIALALLIQPSAGQLFNTARIFGDIFARNNGGLPSETPRFGSPLQQAQRFGQPQMPFGGGALQQAVNGGFNQPQPLFNGGVSQQQPSNGRASQPQPSSTGITDGFGRGLFTGGNAQQQQPAPGSPNTGFNQGGQMQANGGGFVNGQQQVVGIPQTNPAGNFQPQQQLAGFNQLGSPQQQQQQPAVGNTNGRPDILGGDNVPSAFQQPQQQPQAAGGSFSQPQQLGFSQQLQQVPVNNGQMGTSNGNIPQDNLQQRQPQAFGQLPASTNAVGNNNFQPQQQQQQQQFGQQPQPQFGQQPQPQLSQNINPAVGGPAGRVDDGDITGNSDFDDDAKLLNTFHDQFLPKQAQVPASNLPASTGGAALSGNMGQPNQARQLSPTGQRQQQLQARLNNFPQQQQQQQQQVGGASQLDGRTLFSTQNLANRVPGTVSTLMATQQRVPAPVPSQSAAQQGDDALGPDELAALQNAGIDPTQVALSDGSPFAAPAQIKGFRRPPFTLLAGNGGGVNLAGDSGAPPTSIPGFGRRPPMPPRGGRRGPPRRAPPPPPPSDDGSADGADDGSGDAPPPSTAIPKGSKKLDPAQFGLPPGTIILGEQDFDSGESEVDAKGHSASDSFVPPPLKKGGVVGGRIEGDEPDAMKKLLEKLKELSTHGAAPDADGVPRDVKGSARNVADDAPPSPAAAAASTTAVPTVQDSLQKALAKQPPVAAESSTKPTAATL